jgi:1,4-dihydroxy-2-naphthoate octaprenyltransferase
VWRYIVRSLTLRRVEYRVAELPIFLTPVLLTGPDPAAFRGAVFWEGLCAFFFLFAFGDLVNCLADRELDAIDKPHLSEAVYGIGVRGVWVQAILSAVGAVALSVHLAWRLGRWWLVPASVVGLVVAWAYSAEPVRLKGRGIWQLAFYWLGLFFGPMMFTALLFDPLPGWGMWAMAATFGLTQTGVILVNTAEDYPEDRQLGTRTVVVALGLERGIGLALVLVLVGGTGLTAALYAGFYSGLPPVARLGLAPLVLAVAAVSVAVTWLWCHVRRGSEVEAIIVVKRAAKWVPLWITSVAAANLLAAAVWYGQAPTRRAGQGGPPDGPDSSKWLGRPARSTSLAPSASAFARRVSVNLSACASTTPCQGVIQASSAGVSRMPTFSPCGGCGWMESRIASG